ncbi:unnamed protein product, partial [Urochloa humidicola]
LPASFDFTKQGRGGRRGVIACCRRLPASSFSWLLTETAWEVEIRSDLDQFLPSSSMAGRERRTVFVTVGTTCFDALVMAVDSPEVKKALLQQGYTDLLIQMGRGTYIPSKVSGDATLQVDYFTFSPSIADHMRTASLVISHAGSGSIFETLRLGKPLIVVVNEDLMDNHQSELAEELAERKHLFCARPQTLGETIQVMDLKTLVPYVPGDAKPVVTRINKFLGFPVD